MMTENNKGDMGGCGCGTSCGSGEGMGMCGMGGHFRHKLGKGFLMLAVSGSLLLLAMFFSNIKEYKFIGHDVAAQTTITVTGDGEAYAVPDIATVSFAIVHEAKTSQEARTMVDASMKKIADFLAKSGVADK